MKKNEIKAKKEAIALARQKTEAHKQKTEAYKQKRKQSRKKFNNMTFENVLENGLEMELLKEIAISLGIIKE